MSSECPRLAIGETYRQELVQRNRNNPYYVVFAALYAVAVGLVASWLQSMVQDIRLAYQKGTLTAWPPANDTLDLVTHLGLAVVAFFFTTYLFMFFARILVYVEDSPTGEAWSFALSLCVLTCVSLTTSIPEWYLAWILIPLVLVLAKLSQLMKLLGSDTSHPLYGASRRWRKYCTWSIIAVLVCLVLLRIPYFDKDASLTKIVITVLVSLLFTFGAALTFWRFTIIERQMEVEMRAYLGGNATGKVDVVETSAS